jgi:hypothetical protein
VRQPQHLECDERSCLAGLDESTSAYSGARYPSAGSLRCLPARTPSWAWSQDTSASPSSVRHLRFEELSAWLLAREPAAQQASNDAQPHGPFASLRGRGRRGPLLSVCVVCPSVVQRRRGVSATRAMMYPAGNLAPKSPAAVLSMSRLRRGATPLTIRRLWPGA